MLYFVSCCIFFFSFAAGIPSLIFSNGRDLLIGDIHGNNLHTLVNSQNRGVAVGVDFHYNLHRIFWTDTIQNKVIFFYPLSISISIFCYAFPFTWSRPVSCLRKYWVRQELAGTEFFQLSFKTSAMLIL